MELSGKTLILKHNPAHSTPATKRHTKLYLSHSGESHCTLTGVPDTIRPGLLNDHLHLKLTEDWLVPQKLIIGQCEGTFNGWLHHQNIQTLTMIRPSLVSGRQHLKLTKDLPVPEELVDNGPM